MQDFAILPCASWVAPCGSLHREILKRKINSRELYNQGQGRRGLRQLSLISAPRLETGIWGGRFVHVSWDKSLHPSTSPRPFFFLVVLQALKGIDSVLF